MIEENHLDQLMKKFSTLIKGKKEKLKDCLIKF